jgi:hypothetical protein
MDHDAEAAVSGGEKELRGQRSLKAKVFDESDEIEEEGGKDGEKVGNQGDRKRKNQKENPGEGGEKGENRRAGPTARIQYHRPANRTHPLLIGTRCAAECACILGCFLYCHKSVSGDMRREGLIGQLGQRGITDEGKEVRNQGRRRTLHSIQGFPVP